MSLENLLPQMSHVYSFSAEGISLWTLSIEADVALVGSFASVGSCMHLERVVGLEVFATFSTEELVRVICLP